MVPPMSGKRKVLKALELACGNIRLTPKKTGIDFLGSALEASVNLITAA